VIADPYHLDIKTLEMVFKIKDHKRIIIISDSVKETGLKSPVVDSIGTLQGGSMTVTKAVKRLIEAGFDKDMLLMCIAENPTIYISNMSD
jgi:N-acetylglucosamine-6-phosphate deacetylase